jgi:hypothetical protein
MAPEPAVSKSTSSSIDRSRAFRSRQVISPPGRACTDRSSQGPASADAIAAAYLAISPLRHESAKTCAWSTPWRSVAQIRDSSQSSEAHWAGVRPSFVEAVTSGIVWNLEDSTITWVSPRDP